MEEKVEVKKEKKKKKKLFKQIKFILFMTFFVFLTLLVDISLKNKSDFSYAQTKTGLYFYIEPEEEELKVDNGLDLKETLKRLNLEKVEEQKINFNNFQILLDIEMKKEKTIFFELIPNKVSDTSIKYIDVYELKNLTDLEEEYETTNYLKDFRTYLPLSAEKYEMFLEKDNFFDEELEEIIKKQKGDIARMLLYLETTYDDFELTDAQLSLIIKWHKEDPVDEMEKQRNERMTERNGTINYYVKYPWMVHTVYESVELKDIPRR